MKRRDLLKGLPFAAAILSAEENKKASPAPKIPESFKVAGYEVPSAYLGVPLPNPPIPPTILKEELDELFRITRAATGPESLTTFLEEKKRHLNGAARIKNPKGNTLLAIAVSMKDKDLTTALLDANADPNVIVTHTDGKKRTLLEVALNNLDNPTFDLLLARGAKVTKPLLERLNKEMRNNGLSDRADEFLESIQKYAGTVAQHAVVDKGRGLA